MRFPRAIVVAVLVSAAVSIQAMYIQFELENVPVERLVANLERLLRDKPLDLQLHLSLARVHSMAWALRTEQTRVAKGHEDWGPWFGYAPAVVPFEVESTTDPGRLKAAEDHLKPAFEHYAEAIRLAPNDVIARLGQAWLTDQTGDKARAKELYRAVVDLAFQAEAKRTYNGPPVMNEAALYLKRLLDPVRDAAELARLEDRRVQLSKILRPITPLAVPLRSAASLDGILDLGASVRFDADGSGEAKSWTWITPDAGWLVYNQRRDPSITTALQLFGNVTFWLFWNNGYDALCALDDGGDGNLAGAELAHMGIWRDANSNGISELSEVRPLSDWSITSLSCRYEIGDDARIAAWSPQGVTFADGTTRPTWDVLLLHKRH